MNSWIHALVLALKTSQMLMKLPKFQSLFEKNIDQSAAVCQHRLSSESTETCLLESWCNRIAVLRTGELLSSAEKKQERRFPLVPPSQHESRATPIVSIVVITQWCGQSRSCGGRNEDSSCTKGSYEEKVGWEVFAGNSRRDVREKIFAIQGKRSGNFKASRSLCENISWEWRKAASILLCACHHTDLNISRRKLFERSRNGGNADIILPCEMSKRRWNAIESRCT